MALDKILVARLLIVVAAATAAPVGEPLRLPVVDIGAARRHIRPDLRSMAASLAPPRAANGTASASGTACASGTAYNPTLASEEFRAACKEFGAVRVRGHALTPARIDNNRGVADAFFRQPDDVKRRVPRIDGDGVPRGYSWLAAENVGAMSGLDSPPDPVEKYSVGKDDNIWPPGPFEPVFQAFFDDARALARQVFRLLEDAESLPKGFFDPFLTEARESMRLLHYPAPSGPGQTRMQPHTDMGVFTLIFPDGPGLEYLVDGVWRPVATEPGDVIVHVGDALATLTNNALRSNVHRVAAPSDGARPRSSIVYFQSLNDATPMRPLGDDVDASEAMSFGDYVSDKMRAMNTKESVGASAVLTDEVYREHIKHAVDPFCNA
mmetsp:Transcript_25557/g.78778  ORF Transcript_25557/g.78778 Transcript_25557/m.78778 type:complete len:380 (+) Transcript_25557:210-1349(+)